MKRQNPMLPRAVSAHNLRLAFFLNLCFTFLEVIGGVLTNSISILSAAVHDLGDTISLGLAWFLDNYAEKSSDRWYSYGYRRFSLLGAMATAVGMTVGSVLVLSQAIPRLLKPVHPQAEGMAILAVVGITVNAFAALRVKRSRSLNAQLVMWHLLGDSLGWLAVLVVSMALGIFDVPVLDPVLSIAITAYVLLNILKNLKKVVQIFLQSVPGTIDIAGIEKRLLSVDHVRSVHHTHVWSLDGEHNVLTTHLVVDREATKEDLFAIRSRVRELLMDADFEHTTVEIGFEDDYCPMKEE